MKYNFAFLLIALLVNVLAGLIFIGYEWENVGFSSIVLICNFLMILMLQTMKLKDAFKISLSFLFPFLGIIEFVLAVMAPTEFADNLYLMSIIGLIALQIVVFLSVNVVSEKVE